MTIIDGIFAIFTAILDWFITSLNSVTELFYASGQFTFIGTITLVGLGIAICTMVLAWVRGLLSRGTGK